MKKISMHIALALLVCVVSAASASAKVKGRIFTVGQDFVVAGTTVKAGTYEFRFDDVKHELTVVDRKTREVIARADARAEAWGQGSASLGLQLDGGAAPLAMSGIAYDKTQVVRISAPVAQGK